MNTHRDTRWAGLLILAMLLMTGCGGDDPQATAARPDTPKAPPTRAEVVVEPSQAMLVLDREERASVALVRELLADKSVGYPEACTITVDEGFEPASRVRFWVGVEGLSGDEQPDPETLKALSAGAYEALSAAFNQRAEAALQAELDDTRARFKQTSADREAAQQAQRSYLATRSGLPDTKDSLIQKRRLNLQVEQLLKLQNELRERAEKLEKQLGRERWATLTRIR